MTLVGNNFIDQDETDNDSQKEASLSRGTNNDEKSQVLNKDNDSKNVTVYEGLVSTVTIEKDEIIQTELFRVNEANERTIVNPESEIEVRQDIQEDITLHKDFVSIATNQTMETDTLTVLDRNSKNKSNVDQKICDIPTETDLLSRNIPNSLTILYTENELEDTNLFNKSFNSVDEKKEENIDSTSNSMEQHVPDLNTTIQKSRLAMLCDSDSDEELDHISESSKETATNSVTNCENTDVDTPVIKKKSRLAMLWDSDSDEEIDQVRENSPQNNEVIEISQFTENTKSNVLELNKKSSKSTVNNLKFADVDTSTTKKMTPKEAAELRKEIQSESQRMMRDKNVSLPYHKPKAHSLREFLDRRPRLALAASTGGRAPPSVAIKMSTEQLQIISKKLKEREKKVKEFYKSESEPESDDDTDKMSLITDSNQEPKNADIFNTQDNDTTLRTISKEEETKSDNGSQAVIKTNLQEDESQKEKNSSTNFLEPPILDDVMKKSLNLQNNDDSENNMNCVLEDKENTSETSSEEQLIETDELPQAEEPETENDSQTFNKKVEGSSRLDIDFLPQTKTEKNENTENIILVNDASKNESGSQAEEISNTLNNSPKDIAKNCETWKKISEKKFIYSDIDMEIENFEENQPSNTEQKGVDKLNIKSKLESLKKRLTNIKPKLSGGPDEVIDLSSSLAKPKEVVQLMERFAKHMVSKKPNSKSKVKLSIVTVESGGDIHKETVAVNVDNDEEAAIEEKPGAKLQKLKEALQKQMDQRKSEIWQQKASKGLRGTGESVCESVEGDDYTEDNEEEILYTDEEEEAEMTSEEDSEEELENDVELIDKPTKQSEFLDQEADESGDEEVLSNKEGYEESCINEEVQESQDKESEDHEEDDSIDRPSSASSEHQDEPSGKRVLKRILKPDDDSDDEELFHDFITQKPSLDEQLDSTLTADEDDIPPHQPRQLQTPIRQAVSQTKSISDFLTPISFITSIQNLTSTSKSNKNGPVISPFRMPPDQSPTKEERSAAPPKKLFTDSEVLNSQGLLDIQTEAQESSSDLGQDNESVSGDVTQSGNDEPPNTQDLMGICSGVFTGVTQLDSEDTEKVIEFNGSQSSQLKSLGADQDMVISQLLDEEELENFKKKFESPINSESHHTSKGETQEVIGGRIIDSEDEDEERVGLKKKKNQRCIQFQDESTDEESDGDQEEIDLHDREEIDEEEIQDIDYDSEENEIDISKEGQKEKLKLADFLDVEAELSESEWGSEDEDEKDMDKLEFELGDTEKLDEEQVRQDLEKIHMRRMLDDDAREVKLLQEVLLEDGEMHGTGRQRQFKWKNIDLNEDQPETMADDDENYLDEEESEEHWRKKRHEREMFLQEKQHKSQKLEEDDLLNNSQLLKIGQKVLQRSQDPNNVSNDTTEKSSTEPGSPISKTPFSLLSKRGSFLSRSDQVLQRVAEYTRNASGISITSTKTTKNFVFHSISDEGSIASGENKKRKLDDGTPKVLKKLRLNISSPAMKKSHPSEKSKKLFNF